MNESQSHFNITAELQEQELLRILIISTLSTAPACVFLFINGIMLFTLRSKPVFRETCRYILLYNLLLADTVQLAQGQVQYLLSVCRVKLPYSVCGFLSFLARLTNGISPLTLVLMPLERYVAVCYPLRHATILTIRNTGTAISLIWALSSLNNLTRLWFFLHFSLEKLQNLQVKDVCSRIALLLAVKADLYDKVYTCIVFITAGVAVLFSYTGVIKAAKLASTDKTLASRARNTLVLNLMQLCLSLSSTIYTPFIIALSGIVTRMVFLWIQNVFYVVLIILPRCLSSLIYGLRDQTIRPVLMYQLCCQRKISPGTDSGGAP
ncbi:odorant receptor 131-2-like [Pholidichthys leucotaenia]